MIQEWNAIFSKAVITSMKTPLILIPRSAKEIGTAFHTSAIRDTSPPDMRNFDYSWLEYSFDWDGNPPRPISQLGWKKDAGRSDETYLTVKKIIQTEAALVNLLAIIDQDSKVVHIRPGYPSFISADFGTGKRYRVDIFFGKDLEVNLASEYQKYAVHVYGPSVGWKVTSPELNKPSMQLAQKMVRLIDKMIPRIA